MITSVGSMVTFRWMLAAIRGREAMACNLGQFACTLLSGAVMALASTHQSVFVAAAAIGIASAIAAIALRGRIDG